MDMKSKKCVAMILAGGQGSRLGALTKKVAKPAVPFGGKYRIIDFPLSNCVHSGIDTVGVLTQYQPLELNTYIGNGIPWDLNRNHGGVFVLPPYQSATAGEWYKGTANAIYQNLGFLDDFNPKNVLILSGDHIYKMDYAKMLKAHKKSNATVTIAVMPVPWEEAIRFGIMNVDGEGNIVEFEEKPAKPKSNLASMGIYIFDFEKLKKYLIDDENNPDSSNDFGKNIIPAMLAAGEKLVSFRFDGYWKDVGTVQSLWEANMDLIDTPPKFDVYSKEWVIYSRNQTRVPHYIGTDSMISESSIANGCVINGVVNHSVVFENVTVGKGSEVTDSVVMGGVTIGENVKISKAIIGPGAVIKDGAVVGSDLPSADKSFVSSMCTNGLILVENNVVVEENKIIARGSMVEG